LPARSKARRLLYSSRGQAGDGQADIGSNAFWMYQGAAGDWSSARRCDTPGSGLGLAIVRQAAARKGGAVRLLPGLDGKGCGFEVRFGPAGAG